MIQERVRAGLSRARSEGKRLGRPQIPAELESRIPKALSESGRPGVRQIAKGFHVSPGTMTMKARPKRIHWPKDH
jgi:DNA invertase Pin-like site-specific DNA recombinase